MAKSDKGYGTNFKGFFMSLLLVLAGWFLLIPHEIQSASFLGLGLLHEYHLGLGVLSLLLAFIIALLWDY